jgi:hypothetical protein
VLEIRLYNRAKILVEESWRLCNIYESIYFLSTLKFIR